MAGTAVEEFEAQRPRLFGLAYRLLGSAMDAEDVVQDAYLRWQGADPPSIAVPQAWLAKVVTNLSLNRLADQRPRFRPAPEQWRNLAGRFLAAARAGDLRSLERMLAEDVTAWTDGGGKVAAARRPVAGRARVARYLAGGIGKFGTGAQVVLAEVNGEPAILGVSGGTVVGVLVLEMSGGEISALRAVANPDKLRFAERQAMGLSHLKSLPGLS